MKMATRGTCLAAVLLAVAVQAAEPDFSKVPGTIVTHSPASSKVYIGSPGIVVLKDGVYLTKCDEFGPYVIFIGRRHPLAVTRERVHMRSASQRSRSKRRDQIPGIESLTAIWRLGMHNDTAPVPGSIGPIGGWVFRTVNENHSIVGWRRSRNTAAGTIV